MAQLLLELFCEEIPARMQAKAERDLASALEAKLTEAGIAPEGVKAFSGPRRLTVICEGIATMSADVREERKGPKVGAPEKAIEGFMRAAGLENIDQAEIQSDSKKGDFYVAVIEKAGRPASDLIAEIVPDIVRNFHWPKSMRWGEGDLRWVRPLQRIVCVFDGKIVPFEIDGLASGNETEGHRIQGRGPFKITGFEDYKSQLEGEGHVLLSRENRRTRIAQQANSVCEAAGLELIEDLGLLEEVTGLAEWPVVLLGDMDPAFLDLPPEVITLSMRTHQKYFAVRDPKSGKLAPNFVVVANLDAKDGGKKIAAGNARVLSARLNDGRFFWENDKATPLEKMAEKLSTIDFKKELGTIADKVERVADLARELAPIVGADSDLTERAARLCKADLVSEMVYEFPELQGVMGRYYALEAGEDAAVADAIQDHYKPQGPSDDVPTAPVSAALALADKLDTLVGFWAIDEKPTGSKDPFALRRAALGVVRLILASAPKMQMREVLRKASFEVDGKHADLDDLLSFFADRLKVHLRDQGVRHDLIDAVFALGEDDLVQVVKRVEALQSFLETDAGANLLAGYKRAANILKAEQKKDGALIAEVEANPTGYVDHSDASKEEKALVSALNISAEAAEAALAKESYQDAMAALSTLRAPIDDFFENVTVIGTDIAATRNRLFLLSRIQHILNRVADFSKIEG